MIEELQKELDEKTAMLDEKEAVIAAAAKEKEAAIAAVKEKDAELVALKKQLEHYRKSQ